MTGSAEPARHGLRLPAAGRLIAAAGAAITLGSMFLPWYSVRLRIRSYADLSVLAMVRIDGAGLACSPPSGGGCHVSAQVGALASGMWDWRTLIAVGAAAVLVLVVARAVRPAQARPANAQPANAQPASAGAANAELATTQPAEANPADAAPARVKPAPWQVLAGLTAGTAALAVAAILVSPVSQPGAPGPALDLSSTASYGAIIGLAGSLVALIGGLLTAPRPIWPARRSAPRAASRLPAPDHPA